MKTEIRPAGTPNERAEAASCAVALLHAGEIVALPTETVYGLAADALSTTAVAKIFETKERPRFDPLIVHLPGLDWLERVAVVDERARGLVEKLIGAFWPGPLTIVLPRTDLVPEIVTSGLETIAVRLSGNAVFAEIMQAFGRPLAAPSANRFGRISPTTAAHVAEELLGRIPLIVDGGATEHGIESTVIAVRNSGLLILRKGAVTEEQLATIAEVRHETGDLRRPEAPGQLPSHYAPRTALVIADDITKTVVPHGKRYGALLWSSAPFSEAFVESRRLSTTNDLREAAANLFRQLRELDHARLDCIVAEAVPDTGLGAAIMDRLQRAARSR